MKYLIAAIFTALLGFATTFIASADSHGSTGYSINKINAGFDDVFAELQDVLINKGLVIDLVGNVDKMIERTADVTKSITESGSKSPYKSAKYVLFCSAKLTQKAVSASPENLGICPYIVFAYETKAEPGVTRVGYRQPISGASRTTQKVTREVDAFLQSIIDETAAAQY